MIQQFWRVFWRQKFNAARPKVETDQDLVESFSVHVTFRCPCGSTVLHQVGFLHESVDCRRCGRRLAIREMLYTRPTYGATPIVRFSIGYVVPRDRLAAWTPTGTVQ